MNVAVLSLLTVFAASGSGDLTQDNAGRLFSYNAWCHFAFLALVERRQFGADRLPVAEQVIAGAESNYRRHQMLSGMSAGLAAAELGLLGADAPVQVADFLSGRATPEFMPRYYACYRIVNGEEPVPY